MSDFAIVGDNHGMTSDDVLAVSESTFIDMMMFVLYPSNVNKLILTTIY